jgi:transcriptional regulator NrdR family protein
MVVYNENGRRRRVVCPCPKCREPISKVLHSGADDGGEVVRHRQCPACGHRWFTCQEPEYIVRPDCISWDQLKKPHLRQTDSNASSAA